MNLILFFVAMAALIGVLMVYTLSKLSAFNLDGGNRTFNDIQVADRAEITDLYANSATFNNAVSNSINANTLNGINSTFGNSTVSNNLKTFALEVEGLSKVANVESSGEVKAVTIVADTIQTNTFDISSFQLADLTVTDKLTANEIESTTTNGGTVSASSLTVSGPTSLVGINASGNISTIGVINAPSFTGGDIAVTTGTIGTLNSTSGTIGTLNSTTGTIGTLSSTSGTIGTLNSTTGTIGTLNSTSGTITTLNSTTGTFDTLNTTNFSVSSLSVNDANISDNLKIPSVTPNASGEIAVSSSSLNFFTSGLYQVPGYQPTSNTYYGEPSVESSGSTISVTASPSRILCSGDNFFVYTSSPGGVVVVSYYNNQWVENSVVTQYPTVNAVYSSPFVYISSTNGTNCKIDRYEFISPNLNYLDTPYTGTSSITGLSAGFINAVPHLLFITFDSGDLSAGEVKLLRYTTGWNIFETYSISNPATTYLPEFKTGIGFDQFYFNGPISPTTYNLQIYSFNGDGTVNPLQQVLTLDSSSPPMPGTSYEWMNIIFSENSTGQKWMHFILPQKGMSSPNAGAINSYYLSSTGWVYGNGFAIEIAAINNVLAGYVGDGTLGGSGVTGGSGAYIYQSGEFGLFLLSGIGNTLVSIPFRSAGQDINFSTVSFISSSTTPVYRGIALTSQGVVVSESGSFEIYPITVPVRTQDFLSTSETLKLSGTAFADGTPIILPSYSGFPPGYVPAPNSFFVEGDELKIFIGGQLRKVMLM